MRACSLLARRLYRHIAATLAFVALLAAGLDGAENSAKTVLIITTAGRAADDHLVTDSFEAELRKRWPGRIHFYVEDVEPSRFSSEAYTRDLPDYLRVKHAGRVNLVAVLSQPALNFVLPNREALFPGVPTVFAGAGVTAADLQRVGVTGVIVKPDPARTLALALQFHPDTTQALVIGGTDPLDRMSEELARSGLAGFENRVRISYATDLAMSDLTDRVAALPPRSVVFYTRLSRDSTGALFVPRDALRLIRSAAAVPIYGCSNTYVGAGIVGGMLVDQQAVGSRLAGIAGRVLAGESPAQIRPVVADNVAAFDARELQRFGISEDRLPAGAVVQFGQSTLWQQYSVHIIYAAVFATLFCALGAALVVQRRERRRVARLLDERLRFQMLLSDLSTTFITLPAAEIDTAARGALRRLLDAIKADRATIYEFPEGTDSRRLTVRFSEVWHRSTLDAATEDWDVDGSPWLISRLRAGQALTVDDTNREAFGGVPRSVLPPATKAGIVAPLFVGPSMLGVMWCVTLRPPLVTREEAIDQFRLIGGLFANALRRRHVEQKLDQTNRLNAAIFQSLTQHVAVLDHTGTIIAVNDAWIEFGRAHGASPEATIMPGANYLEAARRGAEHGAPLAQEAFAGIRDVCEGRRDAFSLEYECSFATERSWYLMTVAALRWKEGGAVVTHRDVTASKQAEQAIGESEERFHTIADALPVGIWMSGTDVRRTYFNRAWLEFTGRPIERELGEAWADSLHPDDRLRYLDTYRGAIVTREPFSIEYRMRSAQGTYGWFVDRGVPRYASDGSFHGFIGGCLDITAQKEIEDTLRDLTGRLITAQEDDRRRVARELHDSLNQLVALLSIEIQQIELAPPSEPRELSRRAHGIWKRAAEISAEVHRLSHQLHPSRLETFGLVAAVEGYCAELTEQQHLLVSFFPESIPASIPPDVALCVFRIVQEALRNVAKHSGTREATVDLWGGVDAVFLRVSDKGRGFDEASAMRKGGLGLVSMRERVRFAGGELTISSNAGEGTQIDVRLPIPTAPAPAAISAGEAGV